MNRKKVLKVLSIIPARGGSKSIPHKNIVDINGRPLIVWTIKASLKSKHINTTIVSSDDMEILGISKKAGARIIVRPKKYSRDDSTIVPVIKDCIKQLFNLGEEFDIVVLLQPTSPLRNHKDIDEAFDIFFKSNAKSLISVYEPEKSPYKSFKIDKNGYLEGLINSKTPFMNRQDLPKTFYPNGAIYIINIKDFIENNSLFCSKTIPYLMSEERSVDVDSMDDVKKIKKIMKLKK